MDRSRGGSLVASEEGYWQLYLQAVQSLNDGLFQVAEDIFRQALQATRHPRLRQLRDRAYCNWAGVWVACGKADLDAPLSGLLGASSDLKARQLAAYHLANLYYFQHKARPSRLYAGMARRLAQALGDRRGEAVSLNQMGLAWLAESRWREARQCLEQAADMLAGIPQDPGLQLIRSTLIYVLSLAGSRREAMRLLHDGAAAPDLAGCPPLYAPEMATNLAFACLELGELEAAISWGQAALTGCEDTRSAGLRDGDPLDRYLHYAIGEAAAGLGEMDRARRHFAELQRKYYPQLVELPDLLLAERTHAFVTWLA
jgi:tetratricopeptide (TPR) repeat protein